MLKYLVIQLCDSAPSFCHYPNAKKEPKLISLADLKAGMLFGMKENLNIQFVYPRYELPMEYKEAIDEIDHVDIVPLHNDDKELIHNADVIVIDSWDDVNDNLQGDRSYVLRTSKGDLFANYQKLIDALLKVQRLNVVLTDIPSFNDPDFEKYRDILEQISNALASFYSKGNIAQTNIQTDRMMLKQMNNCNAGDEVVTLAPDGNFYVCPAYYFQGSEPCGSPQHGVKIKNHQLYRLEFSPICRKCDAYQCKRCVWLNEKQTLEVNTPGREQCVVSHLERNESRILLAKIREHGIFMPEIEIKEIDYLDPFEIVNQWK